MPNVNAKPTASPLHGLVRRPLRCADLFCGAGGAAMGLSMAGFQVEGWDIRPQKNYPFTFHLGDALGADLTGFDLVWASPPCQAHTAMKTMYNAKPHADLIPATREKLEAWGGPWILENVVGAPLNRPYTLCGTMFGLGCEDAELRRHRLFESNQALQVPHCRHGQRSAVLGVYGGHLRNRKRVRTIGVYGEGVRDSVRKTDKGVSDFSVKQGREAMGIDWMSLAELCQAIPPVYSEFLARQITAGV
jgi:DNA (cytosine-5)-methyltransferase 1